MTRFDLIPIALLLLIIAIASGTAIWARELSFGSLATIVLAGAALVWSIWRDYRDAERLRVKARYDVQEPVTGKPHKRVLVDAVNVGCLGAEVGELLAQRKRCGKAQGIPADGWSGTGVEGKKTRLEPGETARYSISPDTLLDVLEKPPLPVRLRIVCRTSRGGKFRSDFFEIAPV